MNKFIHLHNHSRYSPLDGLISLSDWVRVAKDKNWEFLSLTDTNGVYGMMNFLELCKDNQLKPIVGCAFISKDYYFTCLSIGKKGLSSLYHLISVHHESPSLKVMISEIAKHQLALITLSDDEEILIELKKSTGLNNNIYFELTPGFGHYHQAMNMKKRGIGLVGTYRTRMLNEEDFYFYRLLRAIKDNKRYSENEYAHLKERNCYIPCEDKLQRDFELFPEAASNTFELARRCEIKNFSPSLVFPAYQNLDHVSAQELLWKKCIDSINHRFSKPSNALLENIRTRLSFEFDIICEKGFCSYFLVVADIVSKSNNTCGRGSGASSIVCFLLGITHVDPLEHNLFFDRFLNRERVDPPDIDIDFPWDERDEIFDYVFSLYRDHVAFVANHNFLRERQAIREVAKTYGVSGQEITHVLERLHQTGVEKLNAKWKMIIHHGLKLVGCLHHLSVHCGGIVITPQKINNYAPVQTLPKGYPVIQWEKDQAELRGLVKIDLLGNRSLAVIRDAINSINHNRQMSQEANLLSYDNIEPIGDREVEKLICSGHTVGVFYIESPGTRLFLQKMKSAEFEHGVIAGSIIRPAANKLANEFVRRLKGGHWVPLDPLIEDVLQESFGLMIYQEHVNLVAMALSNFSAQEGNELRKVLGKKHKEKKLIYFKQRFFKGAQANGVKQEVIEKVWLMIQSFAGYSFCKAHSASYCLVSFKSCYLKSHYPAEFMASVISNEGGYYSTEAYLDEVRRMGIKILPPCVQQSAYHYEAQSEGIRVGLMQVKGIAKKTLGKIFNERNKASFLSLDDFLLRSQISFSDAKKLSRARCLSALCPGDALVIIMWKVYSYYGGGNVIDKSNHKLSLSDSSCRKHGKKQMVKWERENLGGFITFPQWSLFQHLNKSQGLHLSSEIPGLIGQEIVLFGSFVTMKQTRTKKKESMCFCTFSDPKGMYETVLFPNEYYIYANILYEQKNYLIKGVVMSEMNAMSVQVKELKIIDWENSNTIMR
jgi:DNA polymerase III alpha subunit